MTAEAVGQADELPEHGFRINVYRPRRPTPAQFYEALVNVCGLRYTAPAPHECEAVQVESRGTDVHVEFLLTDGRVAVADLALDRGIRGLL